MNSIGYKNILLISLLFHITAAFFSSGFHHFDEHFQITEYLNFKLDGIPAKDLAWEYHQKIRPWFQVFSYFNIYKFFNFFGVTSPFTHLFLLRLTTSLFGVFSLYSFYPVLKKWFKDEKKSNFAFALFCLSWFVPYIFTRTSSESFGISFFLIGASFFLRLDQFNKKGLIALFSGLMFALSYQSRFQMAAMVAPLWIYFLIFRKMNLKYLALSALGVVLGLLLGLVFDYWGYGEWSFSLWHYFRTNFAEGIMSSVKQYPFWWYIRLAFNRGIPPISLVLIISTLFGWWKYRKHPLTWMTLPLFLFHSWVGHKELRYIFPIIIFSPIYFSFLYFDFQERFQKKWIHYLSKFLIGLNLLLLIASCLRPANPSVKFYKYIWNSPEIVEFYAHNEDPFTMLGLPIYFYKRDNLKITVFKNIEDLGDLNGKHIFLRKGKDLIEFEKRDNCELKYLTYPRFALNYNIGNWLSRSRVWSLFYCK